LKVIPLNVAAAPGARRLTHLGLAFAVTVVLTGSRPVAFATPSAFALPPPSVTPYQPNVKWGGRTVAVDVSPANSAVAIAASESGGLFATSNSGATWSHIDTLAPFRMSDVKFAPGNAQIVIASTWGDSRTANGGGIWRSTDGGANWQKPPTADPPSGPLCSSRFNTWGIAFAAGTNDVFVGTDCGVAVSHDLGATWTHVVLDPTSLSGRAVFAVTAQSGATGSIVDTCGADGHHRSTNGGATWTPTGAALPRCRGVSVHAIAGSPLESNVLFAATTGPVIACGGGMVTSNVIWESDDGGATWTQRIAGQCPSRQPWVATHLSNDGNPAHIDVYFGTGLSVLRQTCTNTGGPGNRCSTSWNPVNVDHADQNGFAFSTSSNCGQFLVSDGGVHKTSDCGATWTITGSGAAGYDALQLYELAGQVHPSHTDLYMGTQDNDIWASGDNGVTWPADICCEGFFFQVTHSSPTDAGQTVTGVFCASCSNFQSAAHFASLVAWSDPPGPVVGNPFQISPATYIQFTQPSAPASTLNVTTTTGASWTAVGTIPQSLSGRPYVAGPAATPTIYQAIQKPGNKIGLVRITGALTGTATISPADTGLNSIGTYCMGQGTFVCPTVFAVDPNNALHLIAADAGTNQMKVSTNGGASWTVDSTLTALVTGLGQFRFNEPNFGIQAHLIAFDPANGNRILVGTEAAGIIASLDGGATWTPLFQSEQVGAITSFVFDEVQNDVLLSSYGRGIWKISLVPRPTALAYTGDTSADYHDPATLSAVLTDPATTLPVPGATITFTLGAQTCSGTTDITGRAACVITLNQIPGNYTVAASYAGNGLLLPSSASSPFTITREETTLTYTGDTLIANGTTAHLAAVLEEDGTVPIAGRTVTFTLGNGGSAQTCSGVTDGSGTASCDISPVAQPLGPGTVTADFAGDAFYLPSSDTQATLVFAFLAHGAFVLGDGSATGAVTFWSAEWASLNTLSGGLAPPSFKGFAATLTSSPPTCGGSWSTRPGNSSGPPGDVPSFMGVLVSSGVSKTGPTISGDIQRIVVVKTDSGYGPNPGHAGTGNVVAEVCHL
jgi:hypothetical protein